jgi:hypothetical protein
VKESALTARVERLERVARRDRVVALGVLAIVLASAQAPAARERSAPVVVRDAAGHSSTLSANALIVSAGGVRRRFALGLNRRGDPSAALFDATGSVRQTMELVDGRPALRLYDRAAKPRAELSLAADTGDGEFVLRDAGGVTRLAAFRGSLGLPELALYGSDANVRAYFVARSDGPALVMKDRSGAARIVVGRYRSGKFGIDVRDEHGSSPWSVP